MTAFVTPSDSIIAGPDPAIAFASTAEDARGKPGHDEWWVARKKLG